MESHQVGDWNFHVHRGGLLNTVEFEALGKELPGVKLPDMIFGTSQVLILNQASGFSLHFNAVDALRYCGFEHREKHLYTEGDLLPEHVTYIPGEVRVAMAQQWEGRTIPKDSIFREGGSEEVPIQVSTLYQSDWTYATPYRGLVHGLPNPEGFDPLPQHVRIEPTEEPIPLNRLSPENPMLWSTAVDLYEDELDDTGSSKLYIRLRGMADCWYVLLRSYVRVDNVVVRSLDTRIYHELGEKVVRREFRVKESSFAALQEAGFDFTKPPEGGMRQDDAIFPYLEERGIFKDKITYT